MFSDLLPGGGKGCGSLVAKCKPRIGKEDPSVVVVPLHSLPHPPKCFGKKVTQFKMEHDRTSPRDPQQIGAPP